MQDAWYGKKGNEIQSYADIHYSKCFTMPWRLFSKDHSNWLLPPSSVQMGLNCWLGRRRSWRNGLNKLIRSLTTLLKSVMIPLPAYLKWSSISVLKSCPPIEVQKAIKQLSPGKVPGPDAIPAKVYKAGVAAMMQKVIEVFQSIWNEGKVPQQLKDTSIARIYNGKRKLPVFYWQNLGPHSAEPRHSTFWAGTPPRKPVWFPLRMWNCRHDIRCTPVPGKMPKAE